MDSALALTPVFNILTNKRSKIAYGLLKSRILAEGTINSFFVRFDVPAAEKLPEGKKGSKPAGY